MQSIELTAESKKCFCYFYLVPHLKALAKECESASYNCEAGELLGKSKENLRKVKAIITTNTAIINVHHLRAYLMKIYAVSEAQFVCNITLQDIHTPAMFVDMHTSALYLLLASMHSCLKKVAVRTRRSSYRFFRWLIS
jgi:hypothetical protein